jgi:hypothetical protein
MKKLIAIAILTIIALSLSGASIAYAQEAGTLLPETTKSDLQCDTLLNELNGSTGETPGKIGQKVQINGVDVVVEEPKHWFLSLDRKGKNDILACAIITGRINFWMIPYYIVYLIEFAIGISGLIAIGFLVYGGFQYVIGGATEKQEEAKNTIKWALIGLVIILTAWVIVNLVQFLITI